MIAAKSIEPRHLKTARLYADRTDMINSLSFSADIVGEIGVALGDFSVRLVSAFKPKKFVAFDLFDLQTHPTLWGRGTDEIFGGQTQEEAYRNWMRHIPCELRIEVGPSQETLSRYDDASFDVLYIDGDHTYEAVKADAELSVRKIKSDGLLIFNDYTVYDHVAMAEYGVVPVVNDIVASTDWRVVGFAFHPGMFCDIALKRDTGPGQ
jgi:Methyltransferase domain